MRAYAHHSRGNDSVTPVKRRMTSGQSERASAIVAWSMKSLGWSGNIVLPSARSASASAVLPFRTRVAATSASCHRFVGRTSSWTSLSGCTQVSMNGICACRLFRILRCV